MKCRINNCNRPAKPTHRAALNGLCGEHQQRQEEQERYYGQYHRGIARSLRPENQKTFDLWDIGPTRPEYSVEALGKNWIDFGGTGKKDVARRLASPPVGGGRRKRRPDIFRKPSVRIEPPPTEKEIEFYTGQGHDRVTAKIMAMDARKRNEQEATASYWLKLGKNKSTANYLAQRARERQSIPESNDYGTAINDILLTLLESDPDESWTGVDFDGTLAKQTTGKYRAVAVKRNTGEIKEAETDERIAQTAIQLPDGSILRGPTHYFCVADALERGDLDKFLSKPYAQFDDSHTPYEELEPLLARSTNGFMTTKNRFVNREEGHLIAKAANQLAFPNDPKSRLDVDDLREAIKPLLPDPDESWIGVDFDGTLATHTTGKYRAEKTGKPIPKMVARVRRWVGHGKQVKIFTARADDPKAIEAIKKWLKDNELPELEITNVKDPHMIEFWDDKAVAVKKNTGEVKESSIVDAIIGKDIPPAYAHVGDDDEQEIDNASRQAFTAHHHALQRGRHHPKLWNAVKGSPYENEYRRRFNPQEDLSSFPYVEFILETLEDWEPSPYVLYWFVNMLRSKPAPTIYWKVPATGQIYQIDKKNREVTLIEGEANDPEEWHEKTKLVFQMLGFTVHDYPEPPENPDEMSFAESALQEEDEEATWKDLVEQPLEPGTWVDIINEEDDHYGESGTVQSLVAANTYMVSLHSSLVTLPYTRDELALLPSVSDSMLTESPKIKTLKDNARQLSPEERDQVMKAGAVWNHGPNGEKTPAVRKSVVKGKTWYWCATHRAYKVKPTFKAAIKAYDWVETTA